MAQDQSQVQVDKKDTPGTDIRSTTSPTSLADTDPNIGQSSQPATAPNSSLPSDASGSLLPNFIQAEHGVPPEATQTPWSDPANNALDQLARCYSEFIETTLIELRQIIDDSIELIEPDPNLHHELLGLMRFATLFQAFRRSGDFQSIPSAHHGTPFPEMLLGILIDRFSELQDVREELTQDLGAQPRIRDRSCRLWGC
jgi:hypothetical protein